MVVLEASIQNVGPQYVLNLVSTDCRTGEVIDRQQVQAIRKEDILGAIGVMTSRFRKRVGESGETLRQHDTPLAEATTTSLDALKSYSLGLRVLAVQGEEASIPFFRRAIEIDPNFAIAHAFLAVMYGSIGSSRLATESALKAYQLRRSYQRQRALLYFRLLLRPGDRKPGEGAPGLRAVGADLPQRAAASCFFVGLRLPGTGQFRQGDRGRTQGH